MRDGDDASYVYSSYAGTVFGATEMFKTESVEFHVGSEHRFDDSDRFDLEM